MNTGVTRAHVFISGIVQGVYFRSSTENIARKYNLTGWVKNLLDGRVEAVFEGEEDQVKKAIKWCHQGPPAAQVDNVEVHWEKPKGEQSFRIAY